MNLKNLTTVKLTDPNTYNLVHGILLINKVHKDYSILIQNENINEVTLDISESVYDMNKDDVILLNSWNWTRYYFADFDLTYWVYNSQDTN